MYDCLTCITAKIIAFRAVGVILYAFFSVKSTVFSIICVNLNSKSSLHYFNVTKHHFHQEYGHDSGVNNYRLSLIFS